MPIVPECRTTARSRARRSRPLVYMQMYSLTAVGGIQYTTEMPNKQKTKNRTVHQHSFKGVRELIVTDGSSTNPGPLAPAANATTLAVLSSVGVYGLKLGSGPTFAQASSYKPYLKWLWSNATNFREYRVTRATLVVVGNVASTATGNFNVVSSSDFGDVFLGGLQPSYSTGPAGTSVASLATKDARFPLVVDSRWKQVTAYTSFLYNDQITSVPIHTVEDLAFCYFAISNNSTQALGICYLDYDVEFRGPINPLING